MMKVDNLSMRMAEFVFNSPLNKVDEIRLTRIFDGPIIGVAAASDPLFTELKKPDVIGPAHCLPQDWLNDAKAVISYFLPFSKEIREANYDLGLPANEWVYGRIEGELLNNAVRNFIVDLIMQKEGIAVAPALHPSFSIVEKKSNWSERHVAFIAGLGTFGLSKSLITKKGCAGRYGSVILNLPMEPSSRDYSSIYEYCNMCGECINRCPSQAITMEGKKVLICSNYLDTVVKPKFSPRYGCGKCQTAVPCEYSIP
mgnify:CR=1 FL=1